MRLNPRLIDAKPMGSRRTLLLGAMGVVALAIAFDVVARSGLFGRALLPIGQIGAALADPLNQRILARNAGVTLGAAAWGYLLGVFVGTLLAVCASQIRWSRRFLQRVSVLTWVVPTVALGPLLMLTVVPTVVPTIMSVWFAFWYVFVPSLSGLQRGSSSGVDYFRVAGASGLRTFWHLRVPLAVPEWTDGLRLAAPAAIMGAVFGEWFGLQQGLGVVIVSALQNSQIRLMWVACVAIIAAVIASSVVLTLVQQLAHRRFDA